MRDSPSKPATGERAIRVLSLEDNALDEEVLENMLRAGGLDCQFTWVKNEKAYRSALAETAFDVILTDNTLPGFSGQAALTIARLEAPHCPVIFVSGTLGEEEAIESLKRGATDYVLKDRPSRVVEAVRRALRESAEQTERRRAEQELRHSREQLRALAARLQAAREEERMRISREMHDGLGEMLTGIDMGTAQLKNLLEEKSLLSDKIEAMLAEIQRLTRETTGRVRMLCTELRPAVLDDLGLVCALEWQAREFEKRGSIPCELELDEPGPVPGELAIALFRIFQEILTNVARHAQASAIKVTLKTNPPHLILAVKDNGRGITSENLTESGSLGLLGMKERAAIFRGTVEFLGVPGKGTEVVVRIPLLKHGAG